MELNWLFIGIITCVGFIWEEFWYSSACLGNRFLFIMEKTKLNLKNPTRRWLLSFTVSFINSIMLEFISLFVNNTTWFSGITIGTVIGLGIVIPGMVTDYFRSEFNWQLLWINAGYKVTVFILMATLLGVLH